MNPFGVEHTPISKRFFSEKSREKLAGKGDALPDGSFPIKNRKDLANAKRLVGHSKHPEAARALIARKEAEFSKSVETGLRMVAAGSKGLPRTAITGGGKRPTSELISRLKKPKVSIPAQRQPAKTANMAETS